MSKPHLCVHGTDETTCDTWFCRYPDLIREHGHANRALSGYRDGILHCIDEFADGTLIYTIGRRLVNEQDFPADMRERF